MLRDMRRLAASLALLAALSCSDGSPAPLPSGTATASAQRGARPEGKRRPQPSATASGAIGSPLRSGAQVELRLLAVSKLEQLVGDFDKHLRRPTRGQTHSKYGVLGVDLGYPFEARGRLVFLFGDTIGTEGQSGSDAIGFSDDRDPEDGVALSFYTRPDGKFRPFRPLGRDGKETRLPGFEVPVAGIQVGQETFVAFKDNHAGDEDGSQDEGHQEREPTDVTQLARFDPETGEATTLCELSRQPGGKFQKISLRLAADGVGLPPGGPWVLMHGSGRHRRSDAYLAILPAASLASCSGLRYWVRNDGDTPVWSEREADAAPLFRDSAAPGTIGELSFTYAAPIGRYVLTYDAQDGLRRVLLRHAATPWGPFSEPITLFDLAKDGLGTFIHDPRRATDDGQAGPMIGKNKDHPEKMRGGVYAPFVVERWTRLTGDELSLYFLISVWNPYTVELMRADLALGRP